MYFLHCTCSNTGIGAAPNQLTHTFIGFFLNPFLLDYVRLQPRVVGGIVLLGRAFDALMDPLIGFMYVLLMWVR